MSESRAPQNSDAEETPVRRGRTGAGTTDGTGRSASEQPDVLLDVPQLEVEKITLEVDDLRAHVSVLAELANLVSLSVGADVRLARVKLEIVGVRAQALLKVRLEDVRAILEKALDTVAEHPEILEILGQTLSEVLRETLGAARATLEEALEGLEVGDTVDDALKGKLEEVRTALEDVLEGRWRGPRDLGREWSDRATRRGGVRERRRADAEPERRGHGGDLGRGREHDRRSRQGRGGRGAGHARRRAQGKRAWGGPLLGRRHGVRWSHHRQGRTERRAGIVRFLSPQTEAISRAPEREYHSRKLVGFR